MTYPEPVWGASCVLETECVNSLYSIRNPYMLTGFFTQWVRAMFASPDNIENEKLVGYLWNEDPKLSRITILPSFSVDSEAERRRPGVYIQRKAVSNNSVGMKGGLSTLAKDSDGLFRGKRLGSILSGTHVFECLGDTEAESENIGLGLFDNFILYGEAVKAQSNLGAFSAMSLSPTSKNDSAGDFWVCSVVVSWHYVFNWTLDIDAPILKNIGFSSVI